MKILLFVNTVQSFKKHNSLGGIEILNYELYKYLKKKHKIILSNFLSKKILTVNWDIVISSNDSRIFNLVKTKRKILWLHNKLQLEKAFRKKQFFSLIKNKINAVFVSKYLNLNTSNIYNFTTRRVIPNFLPNEFKQIKFNNKFNRKKKFVWSVKRSKGLDEVINIWTNKIYPFHKDVELHIFGITENKYKNYIKKNIINHGTVNRKTLINNYKESMGMICLGYDETFCLNAIEAMSSGLPIITLGKTALKEIIINNYNGFKINSLQNLYSVINKILSLKKNKRNRLINNCIAYSKKYDFEIIKKKWDFIFNI